MLLFCVMCEADRRPTRGDTTRGLELLALVPSHPVKRWAASWGVPRSARRRSTRWMRAPHPDIAVVADDLIDELAAGD
jgi:hypothetical protein